ncbi:MAG: mechanosensitive ion channel protein MscS [Methanomicrobiales archaeon HGW-Methanomicrobiales-3]|jgi:small-conductance mechanosensitive channel|nr:MAG: mechanosensitive ion channel protein MscS [Methanomicrobiales archaeon HGW-Methanomicrobiales-3]
MEPNYLYALLTIAAGLVAAGVAHAIVCWLQKKADQTDTLLDDIVILAIGKPLIVTILAASAYIALTAFVIEPEAMNWTVGGMEIHGYQFFNTFFILIGAWIVSAFSYNFITTYGKWLASKTDTDFDDQLLPLLEVLAKYLIWFVALMLILSEFEIDVTPMLAGAGIGAIALALAAQEIIGNFLGGAIITLDKPFKVGDRIKYDTYFGDVISIGPRSTRIKTLDYQIVTIPNSKLTSNVTINYAQPNVKMKVRIPFAVAYGSDIKRVKQILLEIAHEVIEKTPWAVPDPKPSVYFLEFGESSLNGQLILYTDNYDHLWDAQDWINVRIDERFREEGIEIPFKQVDIHMRGPESGNGKEA